AESREANFHELIERQTLERLHSSPQQMTSPGISPDRENADSHWGNLDDTSLRAFNERKGDIRRWHEEVLAWDRASLEGQEALTYEIAVQQYEGALQRATFPYAIDLFN